MYGLGWMSVGRPTRLSYFDPGTWSVSVSHSYTDRLLSSSAYVVVIGPERTLANTLPPRVPFTVNGSAGAIPQVDFDIGESYAGLLPISSASNETSKLYFWFFPSHNPNATDEITIWLNGEHMSVFILGCF
ncbi:hypothetical protein ACJBU6_03629 [Exserohilum turcicum]